MDIFGIGFPELMMILILAMMVFGPRRLPEIAGKLGKFIRDIRGMSQGLLTEWQREITVAARLEEIEAVRQELELTRQELQQTQQEIGSQTRQDIAEAKKNLKEAKETLSPATQAQTDLTDSIKPATSDTNEQAAKSSPEISSQEPPDSSNPQLDKADLSTTESSAPPASSQANVEVNSQVDGIEINNGRVVTSTDSNNGSTPPASPQEIPGTAKEALNE